MRDGIDSIMGYEARIANLEDQIDALEKENKKARGLLQEFVDDYDYSMEHSHHWKVILGKFVVIHDKAAAFLND